MGSLYNYKWQIYRKQYLKEHEWCVCCARKGILTKSDIVDHIKPHKGNYELFWDKANHQALCKHCHDSYKQRLEKSGRIAGCGVNGVPIDPNHHWNRRR